MKSVTKDKPNVNTLPEPLNRRYKTLKGNQGGREYSVRLEPDLSAAAFKTKQTKEYALWACLRSLNLSGSGYIGLETALEMLPQVFGYRQRTIFRTLAIGEGVFWHRIATKRGTTIKIEGIESICMMLNTRLLNTARWYIVPADKFCSLKQRRLAIWASIQKPKGMKANPISRDSIADYTSVPRRTQQFYDKHGEVTRTPCYRPEYKAQPRLPNIYHNKSVSGPKGMLVKVRRLMKSFITDEAIESRTYFGSIRQMMKTRDRVEVSYVLTRSNQRRIKGRLEWQPIFSMGV